ncbi:MAG: alpha/beta fold hydrolase [Deltaproteobacteria bacterium]|nr:alpha/beta fold hydrolase [Deltaproteobacteria bacterium]
MNAPVILPHDDTGAGDPLLLVHAFPLDARMWEAQRAGLGGRWRVVTPDLRGFGRSAGLPGTTQLADHARDVLALLDHLGLPSATVGGCSMGGYVALAVAALAPQRVKRLLLVDTRAGADTPEGRAARAGSLKLVAEQGVGALLEGMLPKLVRPGSPATDTVRALGSAQDARGVSNAIAMLRDRPDQTGNLAALSMPALLLVGAEDTLTPPLESERMAALLPHATLRIIPGCGHLSPLEAPDAFNRAVSAWV